jgi:hypothetical protein
LFLKKDWGLLCDMYSGLFFLMFEIVAKISDIMYEWLKENPKVSCVKIGLNLNHQIIISVHSNDFTLDDLLPILPHEVIENAENIILTVEPAQYIQLC